MSGWQIAALAGGVYLLASFAFIVALGRAASSRRRYSPADYIRSANGTAWLDDDPPTWIFPARGRGSNQALPTPELGGLVLGSSPQHAHPLNENGAARSIAAGTPTHEELAREYDAD